LRQDSVKTTEANDGFATYPSLRDRVVLISGGASGIGEKIVEAFAGQHSMVVFLDIQDDAAEGLIRRCEHNGFATPAYQRCDVTDTTALRQCAENVVASFGTIDVLVNNAANDTRHTIEEVTPESWDQGIAVNLKHQFFLTQAVIPAMKKAGRGSIVNMSSIGWAIPSVGLPIYVTAKAAIVGLTRTLAHELGPFHIRVNCVMPGAIETERQKSLWYTEAYLENVMNNQALKRMILPEEVARLVLFLAADDSAAITNQCHIVDAGYSRLRHEKISICVPIASIDLCASSLFDWARWATSCIPFRERQRCGRCILTGCWAGL
jgi:NAD(P)-dependent dehydrogenase (short-subunit alcohol dehydrogenase family)